MPITYLTGPDVSHHQGGIDFRQVRSAGHKIAILKASEGLTFRDNRFAQNLSQARAAGLGIGAYHFLRSGRGKEQAEWFWSVTGGCPGIVPVVDCETSASHTNPDINDIRAFVARFRELSGGRPVVVYTYNSWWDANCGSHILPSPWLWIARYRSKHLGFGDTPPGPYQMFGWQYTSSASVPGVNGNCDLNDIYITSAQWGTLAAQHFNEPEDDHMSAADVDALEHKINRMFHFLVTGKTNSVVRPDADPDWAWVVEERDKITTLNELPDEGQIALYAARGFIDALTGEGEESDKVRATLTQCLKDALGTQSTTT